MDPVPRTALNLALEGLINRVLALDPISVSRLAPWQDRCVVLHLLPPDVRFALLIEGGGVRVVNETETHCDARIAGTPLAMLRFLTPPTGSQPESDIHIEGDHALAQALQDLLRDLEPDWEGELAKLLGDLMAHEASRRVRQGIKWGRNARETLLKDTEEYLIEEARLVPNRAEISRQMRDLPPLDQALDDLDRRIEALEHLVHDKPELS